MSHALSFRKVSVFLLLAVFLLPFLEAQTTGTISGTARDQSGGVLPGAEVTATHLDIGATRTVITDDQGRYSIPELPLGDYEIQTQMVGFQTEVRRGITLTVGRHAIVDFALPVGEISERVIVTGEAPLVQTSNASLEGLLDDKTIRDLPLNGRNIVQLALLQEGVMNPTQMVSDQSGNEGVKITISGTRSNQTAFLLDGTDIRNNAGNTPGGNSGMLLGVDTIQEFKVITTPYSSEYGRFTGGVITIVSKSGTNTLHGSVFEFHRNKAMDARNFFDRDSDNPTQRSNPPAFIRNQFGFTLGGPIKQDKLFFLGSYEGFRERLTTTATGFVPTDDARQGIGVLPPGQTVPQDIQDFLELYPRVNGAVLPGGAVGEFINPIGTPVNEDFFTVKLDSNFGEKDTLSGRYTLTDSDKEVDAILPVTVEVLSTRNQYFTLTHRHVFGPSLINTARFGLNRSLYFHWAREVVNVPDKFHYVPNRSPQVIGLTVVDGLSNLGNVLRRDTVSNFFEYSDDLVYTRGAHSLKFGAILTRYQNNQLNAVRSDGIFVFFSLFNLLSNDPFRFDAITTSPLGRIGVRQWYVGAYIQDDYKISPNFTLNLGLRYEVATNPNEVAGRLSNFEDLLAPAFRVGNPLLTTGPGKNNFAPRIGFAWDIFGNSKTALRGGVGIYHDIYGPSYYKNLATVNEPFYVRKTILFPDFPQPLASPQNPNTGAWVTGRVQEPYLIQYSLAIQQELGASTVFQIGYQGSRGTHIARMVDANQAIPTILQDGRKFFPCGAPTFRDPCPPGPSRNPNFGLIRFTFWDVNSFYNSLKVSLNRRFSEGLQFQASYNWAKMMDDGSQAGFSEGFIGGAAYSIDPDDRKRGRARSLFDLAHTFSFNFLYDLPFGAGRQFGSGATGLAGQLIKGWQINGIVTLITGTRAPIRISFDQANSGQFEVNQRPDLRPGASNNPVLDDGREPSLYFDRSAFVLNEKGFFGDLGRNTLEGPGIAQLDLGISRNFSLSETARIQFRTEIFNLFNRANFAMPGNLVVFDGVNPDGSGRVVPNSGIITRTTTTSRQIQLALKILF